MASAATDHIMGGMDTAESSTQADTGGEKTVAPFITLSNETIVCVEHPCIIKNLNRGISSLGGEYAINKFLGNRDSKQLEVSFRPEDVMSKTIAAQKVGVNQILLKVTVPKRTGRKRKRGTNGPFLSESEIQNGQSSKKEGLQADTVLQSLIDNPNNYRVEAVGQIKENHRFRSFPDFQYSTYRNKLMEHLRETIMTDKLESVKKFQMDTQKGLPHDQDVGPPPYFILNRQPYNYSYRQNVYSKTVTDPSGAVQVVNITAPVKHVRTYIEPDDENVPQARPEELAAEDSLPPKMQERIQRLRDELKKRPLMQRRVYFNIFGGQFEFELKQAAAYCGYTFSSGPFKDVLIAFGVDPRKDPKYRIYQAVSFQIGNEGAHAPDDPGAHMAKRGGKRVFSRKATVKGTHIFDGTKLYTDGKVWQVCDITDPFLKELLATKELRKDCDMTFSGWYGNGTWSLFRRIMKHKLTLLSENKPPQNEMYQAIASMFTAFITSENVHQTTYDKPGYFRSAEYKDYPIDAEFALVASEVRSMAMAAWRLEQKGQQYQARQRRMTSEGARQSVAGSRAGSVASSPVASETGRREMEMERAGKEEEDDRVLIGYEDVTEDEEGDDDDEEENRGDDEG